MSALVLIIVVRLIYLQIIAASDFRKLADSQHTYVVELTGQRGDILGARGIVLAKNTPSYSLYAEPGRIKDKEKISGFLSSALGLPQGQLLARLSQNKSFVWVKRKLNMSRKEAIGKQKIEGLGFLKEPKRFYPQEELACHILGIVDIDNKGLEGLELRFDEYLKAREGRAVLSRDSRGRVLPIYKELITPRDGFNLVLNIDSHIQYWSEFFLKETVNSTKAKAGSVIAVSPRDGKVLAMCNYPGFDPNNFSNFPRENFRNRAVTDFYEPGSVFKIVTLLAALAERDDLRDTTFFCEEGAYKIPGATLHDWKKFGDLSFDEVFKNSSNIGVAKIANILGAETLFEYIEKFSFGKITGIDLPGETSGLVKTRSSWSKTSSFIIPIGQEICVSLLQLVRAFCVIANGGYLIKPYIVDKIVDKNNVVVKEYRPERSKRIFSSEITEKARHILWRVVEEGTGRRAKVEGVKIAGKTGTAQKINPNGGYSHKDFYATFVGFFPVDNPEYVLGVVIDEPRTYHYGGMVAAPLFQKIAKKIAEYKNLIKEGSSE